MAGVLGLGACASKPPPDVEDQLAKELEDQGLLSRKDERGLVLYLPDVLFEFDRAELTRRARTKIHAVAEIVVRLAPERTLSVEGHTDAVGTEEYNLELSLRRAAGGDGGAAHGRRRSRRRCAASATASASRWRRTRRPKGTTIPQGRAQNRRVEVVIERGA